MLILLAPLCAIADTPQKAIILTDIETLITESDLATYQQAVQKHQETLSSQHIHESIPTTHESLLMTSSTMEDMYPRPDSGKCNRGTSIDCIIRRYTNIVYYYYYFDIHVHFTMIFCWRALLSSDCKINFRHN